MSNLQILTGQLHPVLRQTSDPVAAHEFPRQQQFIRDMIKTCKLSKAYGLAANQVGVPKRICVTNYRYPLVWVNPTILHQENLLEPAPEGCLSLPGILVDVPRYKDLVVSFMDIDGNKHVEKVTGTVSIILQHEIDHLNGVLITDYKKEPANDSPAEA
jgi:peptide deformylase